MRSLGVLGLLALLGVAVDAQAHGDKFTPSCDKHSIFGAQVDLSIDGCGICTQLTSGILGKQCGWCEATQSCTSKKRCPGRVPAARSCPAEPQWHVSTNDIGSLNMCCTDETIRLDKALLESGAFGDAQDAAKWRYTQGVKQVRAVSDGRQGGVKALCDSFNPTGSLRGPGGTPIVYDKCQSLALGPKLPGVLKAIHSSSYLGDRFGQYPPSMPATLLSAKDSHGHLLMKGLVVLNLDGLTALPNVNRAVHLTSTDRDERMHMKALALEKTPLLAILERIWYDCHTGPGEGVDGAQWPEHGCSEFIASIRRARDNTAEGSKHEATRTYVATSGKLFQGYTLQPMPGRVTELSSNTRMFDLSTYPDQPPFVSSLGFPEPGQEGWDAEADDPAFQLDGPYPQYERLEHVPRLEDGDDEEQKEHDEDEVINLADDYQNVESLYRELEAIEAREKEWLPKYTNLDLDHQPYQAPRKEPSPPTAPKDPNDRLSYFRDEGLKNVDGAVEEMGLGPDWEEQSQMPELADQRTWWQKHGFKRRRIRRARRDSKDGN